MSYFPQKNEKIYKLSKIWNKNKKVEEDARRDGFRREHHGQRDFNAVVDGQGMYAG